MAAMKSASVAFELLAGTTAEQASALVDAMNERIVGVMVTPKESA
jgi:NifU-like protein involved in Fe-S cluster formation